MTAGPFAYCGDRWSDDYAARNGFVCQPGTYVRLEEGLPHLCQLDKNKEGSCRLLYTCTTFAFEQPGGWMVRASMLGGLVRTFYVYELE